MRRWGTYVGLFLVLTLMVAAGNALSQQAVTAQLTITNQNCRGGVQIAQFTWLKGSVPFAINLKVPPVNVAVGSSEQLSFELKDTPTAVNLQGTLEQEIPLDVTAPVGTTTQYECGLITLSLVGQTPPTTTPPGTTAPSGKAGLTQGMTPEQVAQALQLNGLAVRTEGDQNNPKLNDVNDPMLLGAQAPLSARLIFASSVTNTLRAVLSWDQPANDLDLLVIGIGGSSCFQLNPAGLLAELCDRAPFGPAFSPFGVFAVVVINWSFTNTQAYVLSLAG